MALIDVFVYPIIGWMFFICIHKLLLTSNVWWYKFWIDSYGIKISWFYFRIFITRFNSLFVRFACLWSKPTKRWFNFGCFVTIVSMPISLCFIMYTFWHLLSPLLFRFLSKQTIEPIKTQPVLQPVIPGVNLPLDDFAYYIISLILASGFHEFGHALAAAREGVKIHGVGFFLCMFIPTAFVEISPDQLLKISIWKRLKIISAGIWHNYVLGAVCALLLLINPLLLSPFYIQNQGVVVSYVDRASGVYGPFGLQVGDVITMVNRECAVNNRNDFKSCLQSLIRRPLNGYCVSHEFIDREQYFSTVPGQCCGDNSKSNLCFETVDDKLSKLCLPARLMLSTYPISCNHTSDCDSMEIAHNFRLQYLKVAELEEQRIKRAESSEEVHQPQRLRIYRQLLYEQSPPIESTRLQCIRPLVYANGVRLIELKRHDRYRFLFYGFPSELFQSISLIDYRPKYQWLPVSILYHYETLLKYIVSFSFGLAVINLVPCYFLDGQWLIQFLIDFLLHSHLNQLKRNYVTSMLTLAGTILLSSCLILSFQNLLSVTMITGR